MFSDGIAICLVSLSRLTSPELRRSYGFPAVLCNCNVFGQFLSSALAGSSVSFWFSYVFEEISYGDSCSGIDLNRLTSLDLAFPYGFPFFLFSYDVAMFLVYFKRLPSLDL